MKMKPFGELLGREEALWIILDRVKRISRTETVPLEESVGRVLAEDVSAGFDVPPFDRAAMDGYAVRAQDTLGGSEEEPVRLKLIGVQHTGDLFEGEIGEGQCVEIATGSPMPAGSDAVVMVEHTSREDEVVEIHRSVRPVSNVARRGEDMVRGDLVIEAGAHITPGRVGAMAALGCEGVEVYAKPLVAIYSSGPEIVPLGRPLGPGEIYDVNSFTLSSVIRINGGAPLKRGVMGDDEESIKAALKDASRFDVAVFSGGSSVGSKDLFGEVMEEVGVVHFHGLSVKPGKPTLFGEVGGTPVFGMPGYPTSCLNNAYVFLAPALRRMSGLPAPEPLKIEVPMGHRLVSRTDREHFLTVRIEDGKAHRVYKGSGDITSMADADGYILLPRGERVIDEGDMVTVTLLSRV